MDSSTMTTVMCAVWPLESNKVVSWILTADRPVGINVVLFRKGILCLSN